MLWAIFPIFAQLFYTSSGYIQNFLVDLAFPKKRAGALIIAHLPLFLASMLMLFAIFGRMVFFMPLANALGFIAAGAINVFGSIFYYKALQAGDTADVIIFGQLGPLISLGLGVMILGETISAMQGLGFLFIMAALVVVVMGDVNKKTKQKPNLGVIGLTLTSAFFSMNSVVASRVPTSSFRSVSTSLWG